MTIVFTRTREQLAQIVLGKIQQVSPAAALSADMETVYEAIDLRLKDMHSLGIFWRKVDEVPLTFSLTANQNSASAAADILFPLKMMVTNGSVDEPVDIIGIREYAALSDKSERGVPLRVLWKGGAEFIFHPVTTVATSAKLTYAKIADDTVTATAPDVEVSMLRSLADLVKYDLIDVFSVPESKVARWRKEMEDGEKRIRFLSAERKDYQRVAVDDFDDAPLMRRDTDYGR